MAIIPRTADVQAAAGALALRRWALSAVAGEASATPAVPTAAWELFLEAEVCALPLGRCAPAADAEALRRAVARETQFVLGARAELARLAELARREGWKVVVLKGGVTTAGAEPLYLTDLDVLVGEGTAEALARALAEEGYERGRGAESTRHLPARHRPGGLAVEIHHTLPEVEEVGALLARAVPLQAVPGLWRLAPEDHLRHLLLHAGRQHPERRGLLRDLVLARAAVEACAAGGSDDIARVVAWAARQPDGPILRALLEAARALADRRAAGDPFEAIARRRYLMVRAWGGADEAALTGFARRRALTLVCGDRPWIQELRVELGRPPTASALPAVRAVARRNRTLGAVARRILRVGRFLVAATLGAAVLWGERRVRTAAYGAAVAGPSTPSR